MSKIYIYGCDRADLKQAENHANSLQQQRPELERGGVFTDRRPNHQQELWSRPQGRELASSVMPGDFVVVARHTDFWTVNDAKQIRENWTRRGISLHIADLGADANEIDIDGWGRDLRSAQTRAAMDAKRRRGEKLGGRPIRPGYIVVRSDGRKYWYPDREQMPILRYVAFLRDSCRMRKRRTRAGGRTPYEILTARRAKETPPDSTWSDWQQPSWDAVSDSLERIIAHRENRKELPPRAIGGRHRRSWHKHRVIAAFREWNDKLKAMWPPRARVD